MKKKVWIIVFVLVGINTFAEVLFPSDKGPTKPPSKTTKAVETTIEKTTIEETTTDSKEPEYISEFMLIAGEQGKYGKIITYNAGTELEEAICAYYVPAGTYSVTNKGVYTTQMNVYSNETHYTDEGWEEPADRFAKQLGVAETITVTIGENQHIEIHEPTELRMRLISTDVPVTPEPQTTPEHVTTEPPVVTTSTAATTTAAPEVPFFQTQTAYIGDYVVTLTNATVFTDINGADFLIAYYQFTNNSQDAESMAFGVINDAFQNGIQLDKASVLDMPDEANYSSSNYFREVKNGATLDNVQVAYALFDNVNPVEIELTGFFDFSGEPPQVFTVTLNP